MAVHIDKWIPTTYSLLSLFSPSYLHDVYPALSSLGYIELEELGRCLVFYSQMYMDHFFYQGQITASAVISAATLLCSITTL